MRDADFYGAELSEADVLEENDNSPRGGKGENKMRIIEVKKSDRWERFGTLPACLALNSADLGVLRRAGKKPVYTTWGRNVSEADVDLNPGYDYVRNANPANFEFVLPPDQAAPLLGAIAAYRAERDSGTVDEFLRRDYPQIVVEIPHQMPTVAYAVHSEADLIAACERNAGDNYHWETEDDSRRPLSEWLEALGHDLNASQVLTRDEAVNFTFFGHKSHEANAALREACIELGWFEEEDEDEDDE